MRKHRLKNQPVAEHTLNTLHFIIAPAIIIASCPNSTLVYFFKLFTIVSSI